MIEIGDLVVCVIPWTDSTTIGQKYVVTGIYLDDWISIISDHGEEEFWPMDMFTLIED